MEECGPSNLGKISFQASVAHQSPCILRMRAASRQKDAHNVTYFTKNGDMLSDGRAKHAQAQRPPLGTRAPTGFGFDQLSAWLSPTRSRKRGIEPKHDSLFAKGPERLITPYVEFILNHRR
jgi:hypothetical protein